MAGPYEQPPTASIYVSKTWAGESAKSATLMTAVRSLLDAGDVVRCVLKVAKMQPSYNLLVVTRQRVHAGWDSEIAAKGYRLSLEMAMVAGVDVHGVLLENVAFICHDGNRVKVGSLSFPEDVKPLRQAITDGITASKPAAAAAAAVDPTPTYAVYDPDSQSTTGR